MDWLIRFIVLLLTKAALSIVTLILIGIYYRVYWEDRRNGIWGVISLIGLSVFTWFGQIRIVASIQLPVPPILSFLVMATDWLNFLWAGSLAIGLLAWAYDQKDEHSHFAGTLLVITGLISLTFSCWNLYAATSGIRRVSLSYAATVALLCMCTIRVDPTPNAGG